MRLNVCILSEDEVVVVLSTEETCQLCLADRYRNRKLDIIISGKHLQIT